MTYPGGAPGGYPGQGPQQPLQGPGGYGPPPGGGMKLGLPQIMVLAVGALGLINFFFGFADVFDGADQSFFAAPTPVPALFLLGALFVVPAILPGETKKTGIAPAAFSVAGLLTVLFFVFTTDPDIGIGTILMLIFGFLQAGAAVAAYLFEAGIVKAPTPGKQQSPYGHQPPGMYPPSGQFPQQPPPGQYPPPPGQATTFAPQQGQFGQPGQQHPGTPPGGYSQQ